MTNEEKSLIVLGVVLFFVIILTLLGIREKREKRNKILKRIKTSYGCINKKKVSPLRFDGLKGYLNKHNDNSVLIDDITWHDLDMDRLFTMINNTQSSCGEEYLYYMLRKPIHNNEDRALLDNDICFMADNSRQDIRVKIQEELAGIGKYDNNSIYDHLDYTSSIADKCKSGTHIFSLLFLIVSIVMIFISTGIGIILVIAAISFNILSYYRIKSEILPYMNSLKYVMGLYKAGKNITGYKDDFKESQALSNRINLVENATQALKPFAKKSGFVFASAYGGQSIFSFLRDYFNMLTHFDLIMFNKMIKNLDASYDDVDRLIGNLGYFDSIIAIGSYREALDAWCKPAYEDGSIGIKAENMYHPYIENPVKNSFDAGSCMLLTGSNASGKSTFLRTVALGIIMGQTIVTVCADAFASKDLYVYSSMSLSDNLLKGDSYYMAEIKAIKRILEAKDMVKGSIIAFVDEVLRGTNTVERIAASSQILKYFEANNISCYAATHDIELTSLLEDKYNNYHFEEDISGGDITFNYKLNKGKATSRNAIELLRSLGFGSDITDNAKKMAELFSQNGDWKLV